MTPSSRHNGETEKILQNIINLYKTARKLNPSRFNKGIRNLIPPEKVALNPTDEIKEMLKNNNFLKL